MWWTKWCAWSFPLIKNLMTLYHRLSVPKLISSFSQTHQINSNSDYKVCAALPKKGKVPVTEHPEIHSQCHHTGPGVSSKCHPRAHWEQGFIWWTAVRACTHFSCSDHTLRCVPGGLMKLRGLLCWREGEDHNELHLFYITQHSTKILEDSTTSNPALWTRGK